MTNAPAKQTDDPAPLQPDGEDTIKETVESIIIALILAFVFRAFIVEAFVIPTGSMAPTLLGAHVRLDCRQCGYEIITDWPSKNGDQPLALARDQTIVCPMCRYPNVLDRDAQPLSGDRILIQKYVYVLSDPQRWDVVVFKAPHHPSQNYIKRLVGLPGESLLLLDGNVYTQTASAPWRIQRKTERLDVQRTVWQPIYHSNYVPLDDGTGVRPPAYHWTVPWVARGATADHWRTENRRSYDYSSSGRGMIEFDFDVGGHGDWSMMYPYNQEQQEQPVPVEDVRVAARVQPHAPGLNIWLSTTARLDRSDADQPELLEAVIQADGTVVLSAVDAASGETRKLTQAQIDPLPTGRTTPVELWYVDQEAIVWVDDEPVLRWKYDLPLEQLKRRIAPHDLPRIHIAVAGAPVTLHDVQVDRDLHYWSQNIQNDSTARAALRRIGEGRLFGQPVHIGPGQYFCMGDNSPRSMDSRYWNSIDPWIAMRQFGAKPDQAISAIGMDAWLGLVPHDLMIGRAFFVYYPAPYPWRQNRAGVVPNFGDIRFIR